MMTTFSRAIELRCSAPAPLGEPVRAFFRRRQWFPIAYLVDPAGAMDLASLTQLDRSHRRHDDVMLELLAAARRLAAGRPDDGDAEVVRDAVGYFQRAVARHFLDEEGSVFPR